MIVISHLFYHYGKVQLSPGAPQIGDLDYRQEYNCLFVGTYVLYIFYAISALKDRIMG
jgi:hypothetical protein